MSVDSSSHYQKANWARRRVIELGYQTGRAGAHFGSSLSAVDIFTAVYQTLFSGGLSDLKKIDRNRFILSKGHSALGYFAVLEAFGLMSSEVTSGFEKNGTNIFAHAHKDLSQGIEYSGGSLGLGVSFGVGIAIACKMKGAASNICVLAGDGECDEGIVWESLMSASHFQLDNFTLIVDQNDLQSDGAKELIMSHGSLADKLEAFGLEVEVVDGHKLDQIAGALTRQTKKPRAIVAKTIKGKGISFMENNPDWHHGSLSETQYEQAIQELDLP